MIKFWNSILHRLQNALARAFLVFIIATVLLCYEQITEKTWLTIALAFIVAEKVKDIMAVAVGFRKGEREIR